jgi:hypothetical protein
MGDRPMPPRPPQHDAEDISEEDAMLSIVGPAIEAEVSYRHERVSEDFRRARSTRRRTRPDRSRAHVRRTNPSTDPHPA